jgi:hypothetical protein
MHSSTAYLLSQLNLLNHLLIMPPPLSTRNTNRYSVTQLYSMAAENDTEIEDELARGVVLFLPF